MLVLRALDSAYLRLLFVVVHPRSPITGHPRDMYVVHFGQVPSMQTSDFHNYHECYDSDSECSSEEPRVEAATVSGHLHIAVLYRDYLACFVAHIQRGVSHMKSEAAGVQVHRLVRTDWAVMCT